MVASPMFVAPQHHDAARSWWTTTITVATLLLLPLSVCHSWVNEALLWLAVQAETREEARKLKEAMQVSLAEQEAALQAQAASAPALGNMSEERLRKRFAASVLLSRLDTLLPPAVLFCERPPLREAVKHKVRKEGGRCSRLGRKGVCCLGCFCW